MNSYKNNFPSVVIPYFQELRDPPTDKGVEAGSVTADTWQCYSIMYALQGQYSINPPLVVAAYLTATV